jgi:hypothetical protein
MKIAEYTEKVMHQGCEYTLELHENSDDSKTHFFALASIDAPRIWFAPRQYEEDYIVFEKMKEFNETAEFYTLHIQSRTMSRLFPRYNR